MPGLHMCNNRKKLILEVNSLCKAPENSDSSFYGDQNIYVAAKFLEYFDLCSQHHINNSTFKRGIPSTVIKYLYLKKKLLEL